MIESHCSSISRMSLKEIVDLPSSSCVTTSVFVWCSASFSSPVTSTSSSLLSSKSSILLSVSFPSSIKSSVICLFTWIDVWIRYPFLSLFLSCSSSSNDSRCYMYTLDRGDEPYFAIVVSWLTVRSLARCSSIWSGPVLLNFTFIGR